MSIRLQKIALGAIAALAVSVSVSVAQDATTFGDKLGFMPRANANAATIAGTGEVSATLAGSTLTVTGSFAGLGEAATGVAVNAGAPGQNGTEIATLELTGDTAGTFTGTLELTAEQVEQLQANGLYVVVKTARNPAGEIRGWLWAGGGADA